VKIDEHAKELARWARRRANERVESGEWTDAELAGRSRRLGAALKLVLGGNVERFGDGIYFVHSEQVARVYRVADRQCECDDYKNRLIKCKHRLAAWLYAEAWKRARKEATSETSSDHHRVEPA
jgi:hypothetical protein